jgi:hypothetical protein
VDRDGTEDVRPFKFRREVTQDYIREWRDKVATRDDDNPYGFAPAVWVKHGDAGSDHGIPAVGSTVGKVDALNDLASRIHHQIARVIDSPQLIFGGGTIRNGIDDDTRKTLSEAERTITLLKAPEDGSVATLAGNLDLGDAFPYMEKLMAEIEADHPELGTFTRLREMSTITGPAVARMLGDVEGRVRAAAANYDQATTKLFQMGVAIAGWRTKNGWTRSDDRQRKAFAPFDLKSYQDGKLDFEIMPRPLVPTLQTEKWQAESLRAQALGQYVTAGIPAEVAMPLLDFTPEQTRAITQERVAAIERAQRLAAEDLPEGAEAIEQ